MPIVVSVLAAVCSLVRSRGVLHLEILALRHQLQVLERSARPRVRLTAADRLLWVWFSRIWPDWRGLALEGRAPAAQKPITASATTRGCLLLWPPARTIR